MDRCSLALGRHSVPGRVHAIVCLCCLAPNTFKGERRCIDFSALAVEESQILALNPFDMLFPMNTTFYTWCDTQAKGLCSSSCGEIMKHVRVCVCRYMEQQQYFFSLNTLLIQPKITRTWKTKHKNIHPKTFLFIKPACCTQASVPSMQNMLCLHS